jgi:hypothetical protein
MVAVVWISDNKCYAKIISCTGNTCKSGIRSDTSGTYGNSKVHEQNVLYKLLPARTTDVQQALHHALLMSSTAVQQSRGAANNSPPSEHYLHRSITAAAAVPGGPGVRSRLTPGRIRLAGNPATLISNLQGSTAGNIIYSACLMLDVTIPASTQAAKTPL